MRKKACKKKPVRMAKGGEVKKDKLKPLKKGILGQTVNKRMARAEQIRKQARKGRR